MSIAELEHALREALEWQKTALKTRSSAFLAACEAVLEAERALAAAKGEPYAVPITFPVIWDSGAPLPHLLKNEDRTFLAFFLREVDPGWDGSFVKVRHAGSPTAQKLAVVEFEQCLCAKMGTPNDEVFHGHPLHGRGFVGYRTMSVENSSWLKELEAINAVHSNYESAGWRELKHYILPFHDSTFECVAHGFKVETFLKSLPEILSEICEKLCPAPESGHPSEIHLR